MNDKKQEVHQELADRIALFKRVFGSPDGQKVLEHLRGELDPPHIYSKGDTHETAFKCGRREGYIFIKEHLEIEL